LLKKILKNERMKKDKIIYWITTGLVAIGMLLSAVMYLSHSDTIMKGFDAIGVPLYFVTFLGVAKLLGTIALVSPLWEKLKEWAYAGFAFVFIGAAYVHVATSTSVIPPLLFLALLATSYVFRVRIFTKQ
jgi:hypothetical protein